MTDMFGPDDPEGPPDYWEDRWAAGEPDWWNENITIIGETDTAPYFVTYSDFTAEDWYNEVTIHTQEELLELYGVDNLDIIRQLEAQGLWGEERGYYYDDEGELHEYSLDWAYWREQYEGV
jgi:hypothetical protein